MNSSPGPLSADVCVTSTVRVSNGGRRPPRLTYGQTVRPEGASRCDRCFQKYRNRSRCAGGKLHICIDEMDAYDWGWAGGVYAWVYWFRCFCYLEELSSDFSHPGGGTDECRGGWGLGGRHRYPGDRWSAERARAHLDDLPAR